MKLRGAMFDSSRGKMICLVFSLIIMLLCSVVLPAATMAATSSPKYFKMQSVTIAGANGTKLPAHVYVPVTTPPEGGFPCVLFIHSWSLNQWEYEIPMTKLAKQGYVTICYDCRGWGFAGGNIGTAGPLEMTDLNKVVDWIIANEPVNPEKIGSCGVSYGGGQSLLGLNFEPRLKTVVALSCWTDLCEGLAPDDSAKAVWDAILIGTAMFRTDPEMFSWLQSYLLGTNLEATRQAFRERSALTYVDQINNRSDIPPVFIINGMNDDMFTTRQIVKFYEKYGGTKKLMLANGIHAQAEASGLLGLTSAIWDDTYAWFDYWLKGTNNGIMDKPRFSVYQKWTGKQGTFPDWPINSTNVPMYLSNTGLSKSSGEAAVVSIKNGTSSVSSGIPAISPMLDTFNIATIGVSADKLNESKACRAFDSPALTQPMTVIGTPYMKALVVPDDKQYSLNFLIYDVDETGTAKLVQHSAMTERYGVADQPRRIDLRMNVVSYRFDTGHKIRLVVSSQDLAFVLPMINSYVVNFKMGEGAETYLSLPVVN